MPGLDACCVGAGKRAFWSPKAAPREPSDIGRIEKLEPGGNSWLDTILGQIISAKITRIQRTPNAVRIPGSAVLGTKPHGAVGGLIDGKNPIMNESIGGGKGGEYLIVIPAHPAPSADPDGIISGLVNAMDNAMSQAIRGSQIGKSLSIISTYPALGADPDGPISALM